MIDTNHSTRRPKVSVLMITYNHEKYIEHAVRSVMMQETDFDYELIIGEDCSTDRTREIVLRLKEEFPDKIRLLLHEKNVGMSRNFVEVFNQCQGEYIALLEGDDYWIDSRKLQVQADYLDVAPSCVVCAHRTCIVDENDQILENYTPRSITEYQHESLWTRPHGEIITCSVLVRNIDGGLPEEFNLLRAAVDESLYLFLTEQHDGLVHVMDRVMACYRIHEGGVSSSVVGDAGKRALRHMDSINDCYVMEILFNKTKYIRKQRRRHIIKILDIYLNQGKDQQAREYFRASLDYKDWLSLRGSFSLCSQIMKLHTPYFYRVIQKWIR